MRTIIAGSRNILHFSEVNEAVQKCGWLPSAIISGGAQGVDHLGERYGHSQRLPVYLYPADWKAYGKSAGYIRNEEMAKNADALIAVWDGVSKGTKHMIEIASRYGLRIAIHSVPKCVWCGKLHSGGPENCQS